MNLATFWCLSQDFIALVLLTIWTTGLYDLTQAGGTDADAVLSCADIDPNDECLCVPLHEPHAQCFDWIEYFAGSSRCTSKVRLKGYTGARFDKAYHTASPDRPHSSNFMDINSPSGFVRPSCKLTNFQVMRSSFSWLCW